MTWIGVAKENFEIMYVLCFFFIIYFCTPRSIHTVKLKASLKGFSWHKVSLSKNDFVQR